MFLRSKSSWLFSPVIIGLLVFLFPLLATAQNKITNIPDLNGDGASDLIWYNPATGQSAAWLMNGTSATSTAVMLNDPNWKIAAAADFNGDGTTDLILRDSSNGQYTEWLMNGTSPSNTMLLLNDPLWKIVTTADLNGDGKADLVLNNASTGQTVGWLMNGTAVANWSLLVTDPNLKVVATADLNGDGMTDLIWRNDTTGETSAWLMNGTTRLSASTLLTDPNWKVVGMADLNSDKMADIVWFNSATGETNLWLMNGTSSTSRVMAHTDLNWKVMATGDFNGDGKSDLLWYGSTTGQTVLWLMNGTGVSATSTLLTDLNWKINAVADLNGDRKSDILWYNTATGQTTVWLMDGTAGTSGTNLLTDPIWRLQCIRSSSLTSVTSCDESQANAAPANQPMPINQPPVVNAGSGQTITLPSVANLAGTASDDRSPIGLLTTMWSKIGGPGTVVFGKAAALNTTATFSAAGTYTLRLTATDSQLSTTDDLVIVVSDSSTSRNNQAPVVDAGSDQTIALPAAASLSGTASDDGLPNKRLTATWRKLNGSGTVTFGDSRSLTTTATFSTTGSYTLRLTVTDGSLYRSDDVIITVEPPSAANKAPVVSAGTDQMITLPTAATLAGTATDDGLPTGSTLTNSWSKLNGPGTVAFSSASSLSTTATFSTAGTYTLRLTSSDGKASTSDDVIIVVSASTSTNKAPVVNSGPDQTITLPAGPTLAGTATDDGLPAGSTISFAWTKVSGPGTVAFVNANSANASAVIQTAGTYVLRLTASDGTMSASDDVVVTVNAIVPTNAAPVVNAGPDLTIAFPNGITLAGSATDDGLPTGSTLTRSWSKVSGPGTVTFSNATALNSTANFSLAGSYTLRLTASDSLLSRSDDVVIVLNAAAPVNLAPVVNAGSDQTIVFPAAATLVGTSTDDGLPSGALTNSWTKVSGPGTVTFTSATSLSSTATFSVAGTYTLRLSANDSLMSAFDDVVITSNASGTSGQSYYVDQTLGSDSNNGSQSAPWKNAPGMTACASVCASTTITPGTKIYFDRADTWLVSGQYGIHVKGGVSYIGDEWGSGAGKAIIRASSALSAAIIDFREDHPTIPTIVKGFEVDANGKVTNGVGFNMPFYTVPLTGATKRVENLNVHNTWSREVQGQYTYGISVSNHGGTQATVKNVEILNSVVHDTSRDGIVLYPGDENANCIIQNILVRGNEVYNTGQDPDYTSGSGIIVKGRVIDAILENNYVHDIPKASLIFVNGNETNHFGFGPTNIHIRYNVLNGNNMSQSAILVYDGSSGKDPKDLKIYGNLAYATNYNSSKLGGLWLDSGLGSTNTLLVYNNTFYNLPVTVNNSAATFPTLEFKNNIVYQTSGTPITGSSRFTAVSNNLITNPSFKNVGNLPTGFNGTFGVDLAPNTDGLSLQSGSTARDAGTALASSYNLSINSMTRAQGSTWDIGAYEFAASGANTSPVVNAGPDFTFALPNGINLAGSSTDDGLPTGSTLTNTWSKVSGPGTVTFGDATAMNSTASFSVAGTYTLRLTASDGLLSTSDDVVFVVNAAAPANLAPVVNAGSDATITLPSGITLAGSATDDGLPTGSTLTRSWSKISGTGTVTFGNATVPNSTANFSVAGTYTLRLTASDGLLSASDDVVIVVNAAAPVNLAPVVNAGPDFTITLPSGITLAGSATDDGLPTGSTLTRSWSKVSGPGTVTFSNATALNSTANFSMAGTYTLRLTASDSLLSRSDDVVIVLNAAAPVNLAPVVNAGSDQTIVFPAAATLVGTSTDDGLPSGALTNSWTKVSGPGTVTFTSATSLSSTATFSVAGTYTLRLSANDSLMSAFDDVVITSNASGTSGQSYYVDQTLGSDSNNGSQSAPWKNAPGMTACASVCASTTITPGTKIYFDRADTWLVSGQYGIHVKGGVSYIGDEWGSGAGKAIIRASSALSAAIIDFREDHPTIPTIVKGFEVDANGKVTNGVGFNMPFYTVPLTGATKRVENLNVHNTWSREVQGQYTYGISVSNHGGTQATVKNVEILNSVVHDTSRDGIVLYPGDENANCIIQNILVRGNEVYNTGQDPDYTSGSGIIVKGRVIDAILENNYVHDIPKASLIFVNGNETNHFGFGPTNIHIRYNVLNGNNMSQSAILVYDGSSGKDPKDLKIYGNLAYATNYNSSKLGGLWLDSGLGSTNTLLVYNNTFYNLPVTVNNSAATFPTLEFKNNIVYQTSGTPITGSSRFTAVSNNLITNPSFKNVGNLPTGFSGTFGVDLTPNTDGLSVLSSSTAVDTGIAQAAAYNLSINSLPRAQGSTWDIGAYEFSGTATAPPSDTTPPIVSGGFPSGTLAAGTITTAIRVSTNENATCRYSSTPGTAYGSMTNAFATTGGTSHSATLSSLLNGATYNRYVRCADAAGNTTTTDYALTFSIGATIPLIDTTAPAVSGGFPSGSLAAGTTATTISVTTNENATCRYSSTPGTAYASMTNTFTSTGGTSHSTTVSSLINGTTYNRYVRCADTAGNTTTADYALTFSVANAVQGGGGNTVTAASCSRTDVQAAISAVTAGGTVRVPAGTCSWSGGVSLSGIQLVGAGKSASGTVITSGAATMTKHSTQYTRVSGFRFTGTDRHVTAGGSPSNKPYIIDNNYFFTNGGDEASTMVGITVNGGVLHHNDFTAASGTNSDVFNIITSENWSQATTFGTADATGERNIYFEDNTFTNILETGPDGDAGGRFVIRHNTFVDSSIVFHGGSPTDSSPGGGTRQFEVYNNIFDRVSNSNPINKWVWARGSTGVIANNVMEKADSPDGASYPNKHEILLTVGCPNAYPMQYQIGQSNQTPESVPSHPLLIFGNTGAGATDGNFLVVAGSDTAGPPCSTPSNYIKSGRDYALTNTWGWTPYTYPHPLQSVAP